MGRTAEEWGRILAALARGDRVAHVQVTGVLMALLARERLFDLESHWDDICQEVLMRLTQSVRAGAIRDPAAFVGYCATTIRRESFRWRKRYPASAEPAATAGARLEMGVAERVQAPDLRVEMARALDALPEKGRQVMDAIYLRGCTYEEASAQLGMPLGTLKKAQTEALRRLRELMGIKS